MSWFRRKKKAKAVTPPPPSNNGNGKVHDPNDDTKEIELALSQSIVEAETVTEEAHEKATMVRRKAAKCVERLGQMKPKTRTEGVG